MIRRFCLLGIALALLGVRSLIAQGPVAPGTPAQPGTVKNGSPARDPADPAGKAGGTPKAQQAAPTAMDSSTKPGAAVKITGMGLNVAETIQLERLQQPLPPQVPACVYRVPASFDANGMQMMFAVPNCVQLGSYRVKLVNANTYVPGTLEIALADDPVIDAITANPAYPDKKQTYSISITGRNFAANTADNHIIADNGAINTCWVNPAKACPSDGKTVKAELAIPGREIRLTGLTRPYFFGSKYSLQVIAGEKISQPQEVYLSPIDVWAPALIGVGVFFVLGWLIWGIVHSGLKARQVGSKRIEFFRMLLLDPDSNTYSLSKLQFYMWTSTVILGYATMTAAKSLIMGNFTFADVPGNLPGILMFSAATGAGGTLIENNRKSKGSGSMDPSPSDLITTGGVVAAERVQFLVWTVTGCLTFLTLIFMRDPSTLTDLPEIPGGFLALMGISSAGYLGGKLARKPGPRISQIVARLGSLTLNVFGQNLSPDGTIQIDGQDVSAARLDPAQNPNGVPKVVAKDDDDPGLAKQLIYALQDPDAAWLVGDHEFTLTNTDGQRAVWKFNAAAPQISAVAPQMLTADAGKAGSLTLTGQNFDDKMTAELTLPDGSPSGVKLEVSATQPTSCVITGTFSVAGKLVLTVRSGGGASTHAELTVKPSIAKISPTPAAASATPQAVTITGGGFGASVSVALTDPVGLTTLPDLNGTPTQTQFNTSLLLPASGTYNLVVAANGIASDPFQIQV